MASGSNQRVCEICGAPIHVQSDLAAADGGQICAACQKAIEGQEDGPPTSNEGVAAGADGPQADVPGPAQRAPSASCRCGEPMQMTLRPRHGAGVRMFCAVLGVSFLLAAIFICLGGWAGPQVPPTVAFGVAVSGVGSALLGMALLAIVGEKQPWLECAACGRAELAAAWVYQRVQESQPIKLPLQLSP